MVVGLLPWCRQVGKVRACVSGLPSGADENSQWRLSLAEICAAPAGLSKYVVACRAGRGLGESGPAGVSSRAGRRSPSQLKRARLGLACRCFLRWHERCEEPRTKALPHSVICPSSCRPMQSQRSARSCRASASGSRCPGCCRSTESCRSRTSRTT